MAKSNRTSIISRNSKYQIDIAIVLVGIIPILVAILLTFSELANYSRNIQIIIITITMLLALSGIIILYRYPKNISKLRNYLESMAEGKLPEHIDFDKCEDDIIEIEHFLNAIVAEMKVKVEKLEAKLKIEQILSDSMSKKTNDMLKAEQTKVMFESIGAVCHHIGQPATVLSTYLFSLQREEDLSPKVRVQLKECSRAVDKISDILLQIQNIEGYKTVIYRDKHPGESSSKNDNILDIS
ncbi:MAG: hypothetical protein PF692_02180 [Kiritimatiellae bacterium]|jgi:phosphoglycerate-specific signal transduction histidine kinase|nr:hypothetical protein [Kiritimatiellia bacterium]